MIAEARLQTIKRLTQPERQSYGALVLVMRQWPRGLARKDIDFWVQDAAPSQSLLNCYRDGLASWHEFSWWYLLEQDLRDSCRVVQYDSDSIVSDKRVKLSPSHVIQTIESAHKKATMVCWEDGEYCHRHLLKQSLQSAILERLPLQCYSERLSCSK